MTHASVTRVKRCSCGGVVGPTGECAACRQRRLRREAARTSAPAPPIVHEVLRSPGRPLEPGVRKEMESRLAHDFSRVRIHTDSRAAGSARSVGAVAYAVGRDVVFDEGRYAPSTPEGRRVLTHELAHVVQQRRVAPGEAPSLREDRPAEADAERVAGGHSARPGVVVPRPVLQRLGANPGCNPAEAGAIHQAIFNARGWLNKAIPRVSASPPDAAVLASLRANFGPTFGVQANAGLIAGRLRTAYGEISTIPFSCAGAADATCAQGFCGYTDHGGAHASTICTNVTLATNDAVYRAGCVLHESLHAAFPRFNIDHYSGWHGHAGGTAPYPGPGTDPLLNADSYTTLVMDLS